MEPTNPIGGVWPLMGYGLASVLLVAAILLLSSVLGEKTRSRAAAEPYESGIPPTGDARIRIAVRFYLVAMFFVVFDLEAAFLFVWAVSFRQALPGAFWSGLLFIFTLAAALAYLWKEKALDWGPVERRPRMGGLEEPTR